MLVVEQAGWIRREISNALLRIGEPAVKPLYRVLNYQNRNVRSRALDLLCQIGGPEAAEILSGLLTRGQYKDVSDKVVEALVRIGPDSITPLCRSLGIDLFRDRSRVAEVIRRLGAGAVAPLCKTLEERERTARAMAAELLSIMRAAELLPRLVLTSPDLNGRRRYETMQTLQKVRYRASFGAPVLQFDFGDIRAYCEGMLDDPEAREGARDVLNHILGESLVRPSERDPETEPQRLVRPFEDTGEAIPTQLLRASDQPDETQEPPKRRGWFGRRR